MSMKPVGGSATFGVREGVGTVTSADALAVGGLLLQGVRSGGVGTK